VLSGSSPITVPRLLQKRTRSQGSFAPLALPGLNTPMTLSDFRSTRQANLTLKAPPSIERISPDYPGHLSNMLRVRGTTCRAHYPGGSERVHLSIASPSHAAFPFMQSGRHPQLHFRGLLRLYSRYGRLDRSAAQGSLCRKAPVRQLPGQTACQLPDQSATLWVEPSSTDGPRLRGALHDAG
jgi:hypothetical protein